MLMSNHTKREMICFNCGRNMKSFEKKCKACHAVKFYSTKKTRLWKVCKREMAFTALADDDYMY